jgi:pyruvate dehydrogenase E2 component (dihydrolipoamide acetyltransferase)
MPKLSDLGAGNDRIAAWLKRTGESVKRGEPLLEVETDKATVEIEAVQSGTLVEVVHAAGAEVPVGEIIAFLDSEP